MIALLELPIYTVTMSGVEALLFGVFIVGVIWLAWRRYGR